ncbi:MAG: hypothetical protein EPO02_13100 [Nitrospirae bacterium]|nr:MAG: hypothetical protein EPO02_13100 [Nitrospirota bacterium]
MREWHYVNRTIAFARPTLVRYSSRSCSHRQTWGISRIEFAADLQFLAKRTLVDATDYQIWKQHHCNGDTSRQIMQRLPVYKSHYWHTIYRIEREIGRAAVELRPYPLYPIDSYYGYGR